jgi:hypothetical protein
MAFLPGIRIHSNYKALSCCERRLYPGLSLVSPLFTNRHLNLGLAPN